MEATANIVRERYALKTMEDLSYNSNSKENIIQISAKARNGDPLLCRQRLSKGRIGSFDSWVLTMSLPVVDIYASQHSLRAVFENISISSLSSSSVSRYENDLRTRSPSSIRLFKMEYATSTLCDNQRPPSST